MKYCIGIDQGGTKTDAVVMDNEGNILGRGLSSGAYYIHTGMDKTMNIINDAIQIALSSAKITLGDIDVIVSCMTGADWDFEYTLLKEAMQKFFDNENVFIYNDSIAALRSSSDALSSGIIVMGTGGNIALRNKDGEQFIYGYYLSGDYQGAGSLGHKGFNAVMDAFVGLTEPTSLTQPILEHTGTTTPEELLINVTMGKLHVEYKSLSPLVFQEAAKGDEISKKLIVNMANGLAHHVFTAAKRLNIDLNDDFELVVSGGMFKGKGRQMSDELRKLFDVYPGMKIIDARYEPVVGAGLLGIDTFYNRRVPESVMLTVEKDCKRLDLIRK